MKRFAEIMSGIAMEVFLTALIVWIFCLAQLNHPFTGMQIRYPVLCAAGAGCYLISYFLVQKGIRAWAYVLAQIFLTAAGVVLCVFSIRLEPFFLRTMVVICVLYGVSILAGAYIAHEHVQEAGMRIRFDLSVFLIIVLLFLQHWITFLAGNSALIMGLISVAFSLAAITIRRIEQYGWGESRVQGSRTAGRFFLAFCLAVIAGLSALIYFLATGFMESAASGMVRLASAAWDGIKAAVTWIFRLIYRILSLLASLFPQENQEMSPDFQAVPGLAATDMEISRIEAPVWFYILIGVLILSFFVFLTIRLRRYRLRKGMRRRTGFEGEIQRESHWKEAFAGLWNRIRKWFVLQINRIRYRRSIPGLLLWCEHHTSAEEKRRTDESGPAFLRRLAQSRATQEAKDTLYEFANAVEQCFYAGKSPALSEQLICSLRKSIRM